MTSTPPAARPAWPRTAPPGRCTARTTARSTRSGAPRTTRPGTSASLSAGGVANAAAQDSFCAGTTCLITVIYDQSGRGNHLTQAPPGGFSGPAAGGYDNLANATAAPTTVGGQKAYGVYVAPGTGYRNNNTNGIATGDQPEGMYAIFDGTHYNGGCCFDYGNAERNSHDNGNGTMEAIYFGNIKVWGYGAGNGPWIMADLENGLFSGVNQRYNANDPTVNHRYLTAIIKGEPEPVGHPRRQRPVRRPVDLLQRRAAQRLGLQPDAQGRRHHPRHRRRQQHRLRRHLLRGRDDLRLPVRRHRERGAGQHHRGRLRHRRQQHRHRPAARGRRGQVPGRAELHHTGTQLQIAGCTGQAEPDLDAHVGNQLTATLGGTTMCLDASGQGTSAGTKVVTWSCNGQANQQWNVNSNGTITGVQSGLCLDVTGASTADGAPVELWTCNGGSNQQWTLG